MADKKADKNAEPPPSRRSAVTPDWEKKLYTPERQEKVAKGEMSLRDYNAISGDEMLNMAEIGFTYFSNGKYEEARVVFRGLIDLEPTQAYFYTALGCVYMAKEELEKARFYFDASIHLKPDEVAPYVNRGEINVREGKILAAAEDFQKAVQLDPKREDPLTKRAQVFAIALLDMIEGGGERKPATPAAPARSVAPAKSMAPATPAAPARSAPPAKSAAPAKPLAKKTK